MKTIRFFSIILIALFITGGINARTTSKDSKPGMKKESFKANGDCGMCKTRIENGLKMDGIAKAEWNKDTKKVTVTYDPSKVTIDAMQKKIASLGHDTEKYKAPDDVYAKLPGCCHYDRAK